MKTIDKKNISALFALLIAGTILTSAKSDNISNLSSAPELEEASYIEYVDEYVEDFIEDFGDVEFTKPEMVKVFDDNNELLVSGERTELSEEELQILRQADLLTEQSGTLYYQLNN